MESKLQPYHINNLRTCLIVIEKFTEVLYEKKKVTYQLEQNVSLLIT